MRPRRRPAHLPVTCRSFVHFLMDYLVEELPRSRRRALQAHLDGCADCERYLSTYLESVRLGKAALGSADDHLSPDAPDPLPEDLVRDILEAASRPC